MTKKTVLIITPPMTSPAMPSFTAAAAAGCLAGDACNPVVYDANLDFFVNHVFSGMGMDFFRSRAFYHPEKYLAARKKMDDLLLQYSVPFYPYRIRWRIAAGRNNEDDNKNPLFMLLCKENLDRIVKQHLPQVVILALDSETQVSGTIAIINYIKVVFPEIERVVLQDKTDVNNKIVAADHIFSLENLPVFLKWISTLGDCNPLNERVEPDFSIFPLKAYLTPEVILPLNPCFFNDSCSFRDFVAKVKEGLGAKGFLIKARFSTAETLLKPNPDPDLVVGVQTGMKDMDTENQGDKSKSGYDSGVTLIQWENPGKKNSRQIQTLWELSKQGIWNHMTLTGIADNDIKNDWLTFISLNPNIVHSYENLIDRGLYEEPDQNGMDRSLQPYSDVKQIPGKPFWMLLSDPVHLLLYLHHHGKKKLFALRADNTCEALICLGSHITFHFMKPDELPPGFLDQICAMVEAGGSVDTTYVRYNLERAYLIGYAAENGIIVGNSSLKHPREEFIQRLNTITGLDFNHFVERGYTSVRPEYRALGVGARLLEGLTQRAGQYKIFSIISEDNTATQKIARKNKTEQIAVYYSEKAGKKLGVWMPGHMIEKEWGLK